MERDGHLESIWQSEVKHPGLENLSPLPKFDVVIVGAGITGVTAALMLQKKGVNCILVEASNMGFGTTGGTTAHLNSFFDTPYYKVIKDFGLDSAKLLANAAREVNDIIKDNINLYQIYCDYSIRNGYLFSLDENQDEELFSPSRVKPVAGFNKIIKDAAGKSHIIESDCTHLYCTVKWNQEEKSWDCPCHGSRFAINGEVLTGPAVKKLKSLTDPD